MLVKTEDRHFICPAVTTSTANSLCALLCQEFAWHLSCAIRNNGFMA